jgi:hypothetical protein
MVITERSLHCLKRACKQGVWRFAFSGIQKKNVIMLKEFND